MKIVYFYFFTLLLFSFNGSAGHPIPNDPTLLTKIPFEKCNFENEDFTKQLIKNSSLEQLSETQATAPCTDCSSKVDRTLDNLETIAKALNDIPNICFYASSLRSLKKKGSKNKNNYYYCKSPLDASNKKIMNIFDPTKNKTDGIWPRRVCLSKDYTSLTAKSFNKMAECFGYKTRHQKKELFLLFNHESSFILNNRSQSGAKCYGQLTSPTVNQIDTYIYLKNSTSVYRNIYNQALQRCPDLENKIILPSLIKDGGRLSYSNLATRQKKTNPTCRTSQHAPTCLFYSMYNFKTNEVRYKNKVNIATYKLPEETKNKEKLEKDFQLPIKLTEVLHIKGTFTNKAGNEIEADWIIQNDYELSQVIKNLKYKPEDIEVTKVQIYKPDLLKKLITNTAYNGGQTIITHHLEKFIRLQKKKIATKCSNTESNRCKQRAQLKKNEPINFEYFISDLSKYLSVEYLKHSKKTTDVRRREVANFYKNILRDNEYLKNKGDLLKSDLKKLKTEPELSKKDIKAFIDNVDKQCSPILEQNLAEKNNN